MAHTDKNTWSRPLSKHSRKRESKNERSITLIFAAMIPLQLKEVITARRSADEGSQSPQSGRNHPQWAATRMTSAMRTWPCMKREKISSCGMMTLRTTIMRISGMQLEARCRVRFVVMREVQGNRTISISFSRRSAEILKEHESQKRRGE